MAYVSKRVPTQLVHIFVNAKVASGLLDNFFVKVNSVHIHNINFVQSVIMKML